MDSLFEACNQLFRVSIAFRRSVSSLPGGANKQGAVERKGLHCLSAFSQFPTLFNGGHLDRRGRQSPLPFGVQSVPYPAHGRVRPAPVPQVSIAFRRSVSSLLPNQPNDAQATESRVSIAFRRSVSSLHKVCGRDQTWLRGEVSIAFRRSVSSLREYKRAKREYLPKSVSIAFRRSVSSLQKLLSNQCGWKEVKSPLPFGVQSVP